MIPYFRGQIPSLGTEGREVALTVLGNWAAEFGALLVLVHRDKEQSWGHSV